MKRKIMLIISLIILPFFLLSCSNNVGESSTSIIPSSGEVSSSKQHTHSYDVSLSSDYSKIIYNCDGCEDKIEVIPNFNFSYNYGYFDLERYQIKKKAQKFYLEIYVKLLNLSKSEINLSKTTKNNSEYYVIATLNYLDFSLSKSQALAIWHLVILDNPEFYFTSKTVLSSSEEIVLLCDESYASYDSRRNVNIKLDEFKAGINARVDDIRNTISDIHDYILENTQYAYDYDLSGNKVAKTNFDVYEISGILLNGEGVCEAYSKIFVYMLKLYNIKSIIYTGSGVLLSGNVESHAWNLVEIDGDYYGFDLTWNDSSNSRLNYGMSYSKLSERHIANTSDSMALETGVNYIYAMPKMALQEL